MLYILFILLHVTLDNAFIGRVGGMNELLVGEAKVRFWGD